MVQYPSNGGGYRDLPSDAPPPRLCLIQKQDSSQEYGFNLHAEKKGQFIGAVDQGSPADLAGLKQGDRIFAVNGASIVGTPHKTVVSWIKSDPLKCEMLVVSENDYQWYNENNIPIDMSLPNIIRVCKEKRQPAGSRSAVGGSGKTPPMQLPPPRLCRLQKHSLADEFGFNLHAERGKGHFIGSVDKGGIGDRAGLVMGQRIVGVNDKPIYPDTPHKEVVSLIKKDPLCTELLVVSEEVDRWYAENGASFSFENAIRYNSEPVSTLSRSSLSDHKREIIETNSLEKKMNQLETNEFVETQHVTPASYETLDRQPEIANDIKQTTTVSTTQMLKVSEPYIPTEEDHKVTDDLIDQIFKDVPLIPIKGMDNFESDDHSTSTLTRQAEFDNSSFQPLPAYFTRSQETQSRSSSSSTSETRPLTTSPQRDISIKPVPLVTPPVMNTRPSMPLNSNTHYASTSSRTSSSFDTKSNGNNAKNFDIFTMSAKEAQRAMSRQKKDPRKEQLTNEQKYRMIENL
jgi:hypothetical protein